MDIVTVGTAGTREAAGTTGTRETAEKYYIVMMILCFAVVSVSLCLCSLCISKKSILSTQPNFLGEEVGCNTH